MDKLIERFDALRNNGKANISVIKQLIDEELLTANKRKDFFEEYDEYFDFHYRHDDYNNYVLWTLPFENVTVLFDDGGGYRDATLAHYLIRCYEYYDTGDLERDINHVFGQDVLRQLKCDGTFDKLVKDIVFED